VTYTRDSEQEQQEQQENIMFNMQWDGFADVLTIMVMIAAYLFGKMMAYAEIEKDIAARMTQEADQNECANQECE